MNQKVLLVVAAAVLVIVIAGGLLFANNARNQTPESPAQEKTQVVSPTQENETSPTPEAKTQNETMVTLTASGFSPKTITISVGDKVVWQNDSGKSATVDSTPHPIHTAYTKLNLGNFEDGESLELTFDEAGTYKYHNHLNASQTGSITVE